MSGSGPQIHTFDPNPASMRGPQQAAGNFIQQLFGSLPGMGGAQGGAPGMGGGGLANSMRSPFQQLMNRPMEGQTLEQQEGPLSIFQGAGDVGGFDFDAIRQMSEQAISGMQPIFEQNLQGALGSLGAQAPSVGSSAFAQQGIDLSSRALQDFNAFQQQAGLQSLLEAGRIGNIQSAAQAQLGGSRNQAISSLLGNALGFARPNPLQGFAEQGGGGFMGGLGGLLGMGAGSFLGPFGAAAGGQAGESLFGGK